EVVQREDIAAPLAGAVQLEVLDVVGRKDRGTVLPPQARAVQGAAQAAHALGVLVVIQPAPVHDIGVHLRVATLVALDQLADGLHAANPLLMFYVWRITGCAAGSCRRRTARRAPSAPPSGPAPPPPCGTACAAAPAKDGRARPARRSSAAGCARPSAPARGSPPACAPPASPHR